MADETPARDAYRKAVELLQAENAQYDELVGVRDKLLKEDQQLAAERKTLAVKVAKGDARAKSRATAIASRRAEIISDLEITVEAIVGMETTRAGAQEVVIEASGLLVNELATEAGRKMIERGAAVDQAMIELRRAIAAFHEANQELAELASNFPHVPIAPHLVETSERLRDRHPIDRAAAKCGLHSLLLMTTPVAPRDEVSFADIVRYHLRDIQGGFHV